MAKKEFSLKGLFVKEDENSVEETKVVEQPKKVLPSKPTSVGSVNLVSEPVVSVNEQNEFTDFLNNIYKQGNFSGPDYQEYTDALKEVENEPMDEKSKFTTIFVGFKVQGVTKARLLETGNKYVTLINDQIAGFNKEIENVLKTEVGGKESQIDALTKENADIENQMRALTEKRTKNNEVIQKITQEVNEHVGALNVKKASFDAAANSFITRIKSNLDKIKLYLPEPK
jgi:BMFP domain-containing protein YqiC